MIVSNLCYIRTMFPALNDVSSATIGALSPRLRVLVVDDDPDFVTTLLAILRGEGYEARGNGSGQSAIDGLKEFKPDVVISDVAMPSVNGWAVAREVRKILGEHPLLIAVSGQYKVGERIVSPLSGFDYYLAKPADPYVLLKLVEGGRPTRSSR